MRLVCFNCNGLRSRMHQLAALVERHSPDVIGLQETKVADEEFPLADVRALAAELTHFRPYGYRITMDDETWESTGTLVAVANGALIGGGMRIAPDSRMDDGLLDVVVAGPVSRLQLLGVFPRVYSGRHITHPAVTVLRTRGLTIEHSPVGPAPPAAFADGERSGPLPLRVEVRPGAVRLLA